MYNYKMFRSNFLRRVLFVFSFSAILISCTKKNEPAADASGEQSLGDALELKTVQKNHQWYYFTESSFEKCDLPQNVPQVSELPWTETVRLASAGTVPHGDSSTAYALVNRLGMLTFTEDSVDLHTDASIFSGVTADSIVFCEGNPVFYLYRSSFFNTEFEGSISDIVQPSRPFLGEYDVRAKMFYPLVSYDNLGLDDEQQVSGYFWDGKTWSCSAKKTVEGKRVEFTYFDWETNIPIVELSPAISKKSDFTFRQSTEEYYRHLNMPKSFSSAPESLKSLVASIPSEFTFNITWKNGSGTSPVQYYQAGSGTVPQYANAGANEKYIAAVFADGTTYIKAAGTDDVMAFRLPLLPAGYTYGDFALAGNTLYVAWEETNFYKTSRAGFLSVNLAAILK